MRFKIIILFFLSIFKLQFAVSQQYELKKTITETEKSEILTLEKELFKISPEFAYNLTTFDPVKSFKDIPNPVRYTPAYLKSCDSMLLIDSLNPICMNNIANYYNFHKQSDLASYYFNKSYRHLDIRYFNNDSALYLSVRGSLKLNLGMENAIEDIEHALQINPADTMALAFYPFFLMSKGEFKKATDISINALDKTPENPLYSYTMLALSKTLGDMFEKFAEADTNKIKEDLYSKMEYNQLIDYTLMDKYLTKYKTNQSIVLERYMIDVFGMVFRLAAFQDKKNKDTIIFKYSSLEMQKLKELEKHFLNRKTSKELNPYAINKNLGYIYFMLNQWDKSIEYLNKANQIFPANKRTEQFNNAEIYQALLCIYYLRHDTTNYKKTLLLKIKNEPEGRINYKDYYALAQYYFLNNQPTKAKESALIAKGMNPVDFEVLRLLAHLNYIEGNNKQTEAYGKAAGQNVKSDYNNYEISMQFALYYLIISNAPAAHQYIELARLSSKGECPLCDKITEKYILIK